MELVSVSGNFTSPAQSDLGDEQVVLKLNSVVTSACPDMSSCLSDITRSTAINNSGRCTGTAENPTAPEGLLCIYPYSFTNINGLSLEGRSSHNFIGFWAIDPTFNDGITFIDATWAYTQSSRRSLRSNSPSELPRTEHTGKNR